VSHLAKHLSEAARGASCFCELLLIYPSHELSRFAASIVIHQPGSNSFFRNALTPSSLNAADLEIVLTACTCLEVPKLRAMTTVTCTTAVRGINDQV